MNFSTQEEQRYPQNQVDYYISLGYAQAIANYCTKQKHPRDQTQQYAQAVAQRYAEQHHHPQTQTQYYVGQQHAPVQTQYHAQAAPQPQFRPSVNVVHNHSTFRPWPPPLINVSTNFSESPPNLSNPRKPYNFQLQEKKKKSTAAATALIELRNTTNPSDHKFTLKCPRCDQEFSSKLKSNTKRSLVTHARKKEHPLTKQEIENCMYNVSEPKKCTHLTAPCPYRNSCKHVSKVIRKSTLKTTLLRHINVKHSNSQKRRKILENLSKDFNKYFEKHGKTTTVSNPDFVPNFNKKRKLQHPNRPDSQKKRK